MNILFQMSFNYFIICSKDQGLYCALNSKKKHPLKSMQISCAKYFKQQANENHFHLVMIHWLFGIAIYLYILCNYIHDSAYLVAGYTTSNLDCSDDQLPHLGNQGAIETIS